MSYLFSKETSTYNLSDDIDSDQIAATVANVLKRDNLESMVQIAVYHEIEKQVQHFFKDHPNFVSQTISSYSPPI